MRRYLPLLVLALTTLGCAMLVPPAQIEPTEVVETTVLATAVPVGTDTPTPAPTETALPTASPTPEPSLPRALYLHGQKMDLYRLGPGDAAPQRINPENEDVSCFDVLPTGGKLVMGTGSGKLFVQSPGQPPQLLIDAGQGSPYAPLVNGCRWSPDGSRLAYTIGYQNPDGAPFPSSPSGLWVANADGSNPTWLVSSSYSRSPMDIQKPRNYDDPLWSPDGQALLLTLWLYDSSTPVWLEPIAPVADDSALRREPKSRDWFSMSWAADSQGIFLSGLGRSQDGPLMLVSRDGKQSTLWVDGPKEGLFVRQVFVLPDGIAFSADHAVGDQYTPGLFYGSMTGETFAWKELLPSPVCGPNISYRMTQGPGENQVTILCKGSDLRIINVSENTMTQVDLGPLLEGIQNAPERIRWGE